MTVGIWAKLKNFFKAAAQKTWSGIKKVAHFAWVPLKFALTTMYKHPIISSALFTVLDLIKQYYKPVTGGGFRQPKSGEE